MSLKRMMEIATKYANGEDEDRLRSGKLKSVAQETGGNSNWKQKRKAEPAAPGEALAVTQGKFKGKPKGPWNPKRLKTRTEMMCWTYHVSSTQRKMKRVISFTRNIPLDSVDSLSSSSKASSPKVRKGSWTRSRTKRTVTTDTPKSIPP